MVRKRYNAEYKRQLVEEFKQKCEFFSRCKWARLHNIHPSTFNTWYYEYNKMNYDHDNKTSTTQLNLIDDNKTVDSVFDLNPQADKKEENTGWEVSIQHKDTQIKFQKGFSPSRLAEFIKLLNS